jgi:hypothetical protein
MGNTLGQEDAKKQSDRRIFVSLVGYVSYPAKSSFSNPFVVYEFDVAYQRYRWRLKKRYHEAYSFYSSMFIKYGSLVHSSPFPPRQYQLWRELDDDTLLERGRQVSVYLESLGCYQQCLSDSDFWLFLEVGKVSI